MASLFSQCQGGQGGAGECLDQYLKLTLGAPAGRTHEQMKMCRKFGWGRQPGMGFGMGAEGVGGDGGYSMRVGPQAVVMGGEASVDNARAELSGDGLRNALPPDGSAPPVVYDTQDVLEQHDLVPRASEAVSGEFTIERYRELIDTYFDRLTVEPGRSR
jgi:hypothetical protein